MSDNLFLDTNILVYSYSNNELDKQRIARSLITNHNTHISTQVLQELVNTIIRKYKLTYTDARSAVQECCHNNILHINTQETISQATEIAEKYGYSFYDSLIISAALESKSTIF